MKKIIYTFLLAFVFQGVFAQQRELSGYTEGYIPELQKVDHSLNFLLMGDFGRYGQFYQKEVVRLPSFFLLMHQFGLESQEKE